METRAEAIAELRERFLKKLNDEGPPDPRGFHPADIDRVKNHNDWLKRFLEHNEQNIQESLNMLWETCTWRRKFGTNDLTEDNVRKDYLEDGVCFGYGKDKDNKILFVIKLKLHVKGQKNFSELQRCIVYWFERLEKEGNGNQISLFFDMADAGLSNADMELTKYLIGLFKNYYPNFLNNIILFEMPWILNTVFSIVKTVLPEKAKPKLKTVNSSNLKDYVDPSIALKCWGGNNEYTFKFVPQAQTNSDAAMNGKFDNKKVHFSEASPLTDHSPSEFGDQSNEEQLLLIEPEAITFNKSGSEISGTITLKNTAADKTLSYKIKTTSPEKFRVRPSSGILAPQEHGVVTVVLQPAYNVHGLFHNDKFLVMCLPLKNATATAQEIRALWKSGKPAEQHRLKCCNGGVESYENSKPHSILSSGMSDDKATNMLYTKISRLEDNCNKLRTDITSLKYLLVLSIILTITMALAIIYILRIDITNATEPEACHVYRDI